MSECGGADEAFLCGLCMFSLRLCKLPLPLKTCKISAEVWECSAAQQVLIKPKTITWCVIIPDQRRGTAKSQFFQVLVFLISLISFSISHLIYIKLSLQGPISQNTFFSHYGDNFSAFVAPTGLKLSSLVINKYFEFFYCIITSLKKLKKKKKSVA